MRELSETLSLTLVANRQSEISYRWRYPIQW